MTQNRLNGQFTCSENEIACNQGRLAANEHLLVRLLEVLKPRFRRFCIKGYKDANTPTTR